MEINIQAIADEKIKELHESGKIKDRIEKGIEETVLKAIDDAVSGYEIRRNIEKSVKESVSSVVNDIGFSGYNGFVAETIKAITEGVVRDDVAQKIQRVFNDLLVAKHDGIKLSEIFEAYRKWVCEDVEESEKWERREFVCDIEEHDSSSGNYTHYTVRFNDEGLSKYEKAQIEFGFLVSTDRDEKTATLSRLALDGKYMDGTFTLGYMSEVQALLANLYFNKTEIILDFDDVNDSSHFDIDD